MAKKKEIADDEVKEAVEQEINHIFEHFIDNINQHTSKLVEDLDEFRNLSSPYNWHKLRLSLDQTTTILNNVDNFIGESFDNH